jgi:hypothetical protein
MGAEDKASNKIDDLGGKAKEGLGKVRLLIALHPLVAEPLPKHDR